MVYNRQYKNGQRCEQLSGSKCTEQNLDSNIGVLHIITAIVDVNNNIVESGEGNNSLTANPYSYIKVGISFKFLRACIIQQLTN